MLKQKSSTCSIVSMFIVISKRLYGNSYGKGALTLGCTSDMTKDYCGDENLDVIPTLIGILRSVIRRIFWWKRRKNVLGNRQSAGNRRWHPVQNEGKRHRRHPMKSIAERGKTYLRHPVNSTAIFFQSLEKNGYTPGKTATENWARKKHVVHARCGAYANKKCRPTWISQNFERNGIGLNARSDTSVFASTSVGPWPSAKEDKME